MNISSALYLFQKIFSSTWDGTSAVSEHITTLQTIESHLAGMKFSVDDKVLSFILLISLLKTSEWEMFKSSVANTMTPVHHLSMTQNTYDCNTYKKWVSELRKGGFRKLEKGKDKANVAEEAPDPPESAKIANEHVSQLAAQQ
ncbi:hypothetical protein PAXRUDRAFT_19067 [Paxillus rubicundulus Ve08.2h10]|uniref:Uncharacterized protein n=1 Tax=Paxillus rubicundulus Ve08.2h10 TaxID=930991 RepID=A0A0D0DDC5_9AGAM|nr:hypothetical protein PAXRUDRAFT_19067 [Paxillus rubicundulus Ve08.2h10]